MRNVIAALAVVFVLAAALVAIAGCTRTSALSPATPKERIGVYDSRAIAVAFVGSPAYNASRGKKLAEMKAAHDKAKAEGGHKRVAELEAWGKAQQALLHRQAFSTAPVDGILVQIKDRLPAIKKEAGVSVLVSKWDKDTLATHLSAERIDVTTALIDAFDPTERQRKSAIEIQKRKPIPLDRAE